MDLEVPLTKGQVTFIDDAFAALTKKKWAAWWNQGTRSFYVRRCTRTLGRHATILLHREIMETHLGRKLRANEHVDHHDRNTLNNRLANLRPCSPSENARNRGKPTNNRSGFKGVHWGKDRSGWIASVTVNRKNHHIGSFRDVEEAARAYDAVAIKLHGRFALLNFPSEGP